MSRTEGFGWQSPIKQRYSLSSEQRASWVDLALHGDGRGVCWGINLASYAQRHHGPPGAGVCLEPSFAAVIDVREVVVGEPETPDPVVDRAAGVASLPAILSCLQRERGMQLRFGDTKFEHWLARTHG